VSRLSRPYLSRKKKGGGSKKVLEEDKLKETNHQSVQGGGFLANAPLQGPPALETGPRQRIILSFFKGIWTQPGGEEQALKNDAEKMIADGVNIFAVPVEYEIDSNGNVKPVAINYRWEKNKEGGYINLIKMAHNAGLGVFLTIDFVYLQDLEVPEKIKKIAMKNCKSVALYWAEIAEREGVELFAPINEPTQIFGLKEGIEWLEDILPQLKQKFKGELVVKFFGPEVGDFSKYGSISGYDYLSLHVYAIDVSEEEFFNYLENKVIPFANWGVKKYNLKGYLFGEMGVPLQEKNQAQIFQKFFEQTWNSAKGYFLCGWGPKIMLDDPFPDTCFTGTPAEEVIKNWYTRN